MDFINVLQSNRQKNFDHVISLRDVGDGKPYECIRMSVLEYVNKDGEVEVNSDILEVKVHADKSTWDIFFFDGKTMCFLEPQGYKINSTDAKLHALYRELLREKDLKKTMFIQGVFQFFFDKLEVAAKSSYQSNPSLAKE